MAKGLKMGMVEKSSLCSQVLIVINGCSIINLDFDPLYLCPPEMIYSQGGYLDHGDHGDKVPEVVGMKLSESSGCGLRSHRVVDEELGRTIEDSQLFLGALEMISIRAYPQQIAYAKAVLG